MVFRRRERRSFWRILTEFVYPRGGWARAFEYVKHRVRRLPDTPVKISRGIWAGIFLTFTPFFGLHIVLAMVLAKVMRGNILAAVMATFFGNPLTFPVISVGSLNFGYYLLGTRGHETASQSMGRKFNNAGYDLWHNFTSLFTPEKADWRGLAVFYDDVFLPYLIGGIAPGVICATLAYLLAVPLITAYQNRRRNKLRAKLDQLKNRAKSD